LLLYSSYLPLGVPNWTVLYIINTVSHQCLRLQASLPARGRGLHHLLPSKGEGPRLVPDNALSGGLSWVGLVGDSLRALFLDPFQEMEEGKGMPPWKSFRRCRSRSSHDIFEKLCRRSNPCLFHALGASSLALLAASSLPPPVGGECHGPGYM
jgi:hypothetical protein